MLPNPSSLSTQASGAVEGEVWQFSTDQIRFRPYCDKHACKRCASACERRALLLSNPADPPTGQALAAEDAYVYSHIVFSPSRQSLLKFTECYGPGPGPPGEAAVTLTDRNDCRLINLSQVTGAKCLLSISFTYLYEHGLVHAILFGLLPYRSLTPTRPMSL